MMGKLEGYTPEQIEDAEKLCQIKEGFESKWVFIRMLTQAYMSGIESGIAMEQDIRLGKE